MSIFSFFGRPGRAARAPHSRPVLDTLEERRLLSTTTANTSISGFVFHDVNNNGLFDAGEPPIAGNTLQLFHGTNVSGPPIATAVTDANGYYQFTIDNSVSQTPATLPVLATFDNAKTGWTKTAQVARFDPSLGTLLSVDIVSTGTLQSEFQFENIDAEPGTITGTINGTVTVNVPGASPLVTNLTASDSFSAAAYDGTIDFGGASGHDSGTQTHSASQSVTITDAAALQQFEGSGSLTVSAHAGATSTASGPGNLLALHSASAGAKVQLVYHYIPSNALKPGTYTIVQPSTPPGYIAGLKSSGGTVIPHSASTNSIQVNLTNGVSTDNDFGELKPSSLSGHVYIDLNNDGVREAGEPPVPGTTVTLTGTNDLGAIVPLVMATDANGAYSFGNLRPGSYTITKTPPPGLLEGKNSLGTLNGVTAGTVGGNDQFFVTVAQDQSGLNYDFGELLPAAPPQVTPPQVPPPAVLSKVLFLSSTFGRRF
jgi:hypothetical protein